MRKRHDCEKDGREFSERAHEDVLTLFSFACRSLVGGSLIKGREKMALESNKKANRSFKECNIIAPVINFDSFKNRTCPICHRVI